MKKLFFLFVSSAVLFSCKKNNDNNSSCSIDVAHIAGAYKFTAYTYKQNPTSPDQDYFNVIFPNACERDDILTFNSNGNWTLTDAGVICSPANSDNGLWSLSGNTMNVDGDLSTIESFDCKTLVMVSSDVMVTGDKMKITLTKQ